MGRTEDAINSYQSAYKSKHDHGEAYFSLAKFKTYSFNDDEISQMNNQVNRIDISLQDRVYFHFALSQGFESKGNYDESFYHLRKR